MRQAPRGLRLARPEARAETDGLTCHRTAAQQSADLRRDHENLAAGLRTVRFSHAQISYEPEYVEAVLTGLSAFP